MMLNPLALFQVTSLMTYKIQLWILHKTREYFNKTVKMW